MRMDGCIGRSRCKEHRRLTRTSKLTSERRTAAMAELHAAIDDIWLSNGIQRKLGRSDGMWIEHKTSGMIEFEG